MELRGVNVRNNAKLSKRTNASGQMIIVTPTDGGLEATFGADLTMVGGTGASLAGALAGVDLVMTGDLRASIKSLAFSISHYPKPM